MNFKLKNRRTRDICVIKLSKTNVITMPHIHTDQINHKTMYFNTHLPLNKPIQEEKSIVLKSLCKAIRSTHR